MSPASAAAPAPCDSVATVSQPSPDMAQAGGTQPENLGKALSGVPDWVKAKLEAGESGFACCSQAKL